MTTATIEPVPTEMHRPRRRHDVRLRRIDGEALVFDPLSADTHHLNPTALFIWLECDGRTEPADIAVRLTEQYAVSPEEGIGHVDRALGDLARRGLIVFSNVE